MKKVTPTKKQGYTAESFGKHTKHLSKGDLMEETPNDQNDSCSSPNFRLRSLREERSRLKFIKSCSQTPKNSRLHSVEKEKISELEER